MNPRAPPRPRVFLALGIANSGVSADSLEHGLSDVFGTIAAEGITEAELAKAKNAYRSRVIVERQQALYRAEALQAAHLFLGDPDAVNTAWRRPWTSPSPT